MKKLISLLLLFTTLTSCAQIPKDENFKLDLLVKQDDIIWGFDFLPEDKIIFTERSGKLYVYNPKTKDSKPVTGVPEVYAKGQGGLLDVRVHPKNGFIYLTYSAPAKEDKSTTVLGRGKLKDNKLVEFKEIFTALPASANDYHYGSRIEFDDKGHVFMTLGERGERMAVQDLNNHFGKVVRLNEDGTTPKDNPYVGKKNAKPEVWSLGIRSPQGLAMRPETSELWLAEMGPKGGDELNIVTPKANYGWPETTYGTEYSGEKLGKKQKPGVTEPVVYWVPSISPSGMTFWEKDIWLATLSGQHLRKLTLKGTSVTDQTEHLKERDWRFRSVRTGPDGFLYFSTDEGRLGRLVPVKM